MRRWNTHESALQIAQALGVTKNVVIGTVTRLRKKGLITREKEKNDAGRHRGKMVPPLRLARPATPMARLFSYEPNIEPSSRADGSVDLMSLERHHCRFPVSRIDDQHYFCGSPRRDIRSSYCEKHHQVVWIKGSRMSRKRKPKGPEQWTRTIT